MINIVLVSINIIGVVASFFGLAAIDRQNNKMNMEWKSRFKMIFYIMIGVSSISLLIRVIDLIR